MRGQEGRTSTYGRRGGVEPGVLVPGAEEHVSLRRRAAERLRGRKQRCLLVRAWVPLIMGIQAQCQIGRRVQGRDGALLFGRLAYLPHFVLGILYSLLLLEQKGSVQFRIFLTKTNQPNKQSEWESQCTGCGHCPRSPVGRRL